MGLLLVQPLLALGVLPEAAGSVGRRVHRLVGGLLVFAILVHVVGLWLTSPPDVVDALLFRSPTPFSAWGVLAMWLLFGAALLAFCRRSFRVKLWRRLHLTLVSMAVLGSVVHAALIEGTMGQISKAVLCALVVAALGVVWRRYAPKLRSRVRG